MREEIYVSYHYFFFSVTVLKSHDILYVENLQRIFRNRFFKIGQKITIDQNIF